MGARGPFKMPAQLRVVTDTRLAETAAEDVPRQAPAKTAEVEESETLSVLWDEIVPQLDAAGLISPADGMVVTQLLRHYVASGLAMDVVVAEGVTVVDKAIAGGMKKHPAEQVLRSESEMFLKYAQQLGMTFVARARTPSTKAGSGGSEPNPFASSSVG